MSRTLGLFASATLICMIGSTVLPASAQDQSVESLESALRENVCSGSWDTAMNTVSQLIVSDEISSTYRQELVSYRHQIEAWRAIRATPSSTSECAGTSTFVTSELTEQEPSQGLDWAGAAQSLGFSSGVSVVSAPSQRSRAPYNFSASISRIIPRGDNAPNRFDVVGTVTNTGTEVATVVEVFYESFNRVEGYLESTGSFSTLVATVLMPGETATFEAGFDRGQVVKIIAVESYEATIFSNACHPQQDCGRTVRAQR